MGETTYIQTDANTANLVELLLLEIKDLKASVSRLNPQDCTQLITEREAADRLCISYRTLVTIRTENKISYRLVGNSVRYTPGDIEEFEEKCKRPFKDTSS